MKGSIYSSRSALYSGLFENGFRRAEKGAECELGHKKMETTYKYVHLDRTNLRQEMEQGAL